MIHTRKTYHFSHSITQGGYLYIQKSHTTITDKDMLREVVQLITEKFQLLDVTLKIYDKLLFLFFMSAPRYRREYIIEEIRTVIAPFGTWDSEYVLTTVYDLSEQTIKRELVKLGFSYDDGRKPLKRPQRNIAPIILNAVHTVNSGRQKVALFLAGSKAEPLIPLQQKLGYGGLFWYNSKTIEGFLLQLEKQGYIEKHILRTPDYSYPVLMLTEEGKCALEEKKEIPLVQFQLPAKIGESENTTYELFIKGRKPEQIATERGLQVSTIYDHFIRLIGAGKINAQAVINGQIIKKVLQAKSTFLREPRLRELKDLLPKISYEEIRCVLADRTLKEGMKR